MGGLSRFALSISLALVCGCAADSLAPGEPPLTTTEQSLETCPSADRRALAAHIQLLHGPTPGEPGDTEAANFMFQLFDYANDRWGERAGMENLLDVIYGFSPLDLDSRGFTEGFDRLRGNDSPCAIDGGWTTADGVDLRDDFDEDGSTNQVYHTMVYILGGYLGPLSMMERYSTDHELESWGHVEDHWIADAGIALGGALKNRQSLRAFVQGRIAYWQGAYGSPPHGAQRPIGRTPHLVTYRRLDHLLSGDTRYTQTVTWENLPAMAWFVFGDERRTRATGIRDAEWVRCEASAGCNVYYGAYTGFEGNPLLGVVPRGTAMGVFARSFGDYVVSYPMTSHGSTVQIVDAWGDDWVHGGYHPHGPQPTDDRATRHVWCAQASCTVRSAIDLALQPEPFGTVPRCRQMGVFVSDLSTGYDVVSYPMRNEGGEVQVVTRAEGWVTARPSGC